MSKIKLLRAENFKAIENFEAEFKGCSAIITAGNDKGKTSFLRGLIDRIRFIRPDIIVRKGAEEGQQEMILDSGEKFIWEYDNKGFDKLYYVTDKNVKKSVTKELGARFFPEGFDVDRFLNSSPKEQRKQLQAIAKIDFTEIDTRYQKAYDERTEKNAEAERFHVKLTKMLEVPKVEFVDMETLKARKEAERNRLNGLYTKNKAENDAARSEWNNKCRAIDKECSDHNDAQKAKQDITEKANRSLRELAGLGYGGSEVADWIGRLLKEIAPFKVAADLYPKEPAYIEERPSDAELQKIDSEILAATETNNRAQAYKDYIDFKANTDKAKIEAEEADGLVKAIDAERTEMISKADFPEGVSMDANGVTISGLPFIREQLSSSVIYKTALKLAAMNLGKVKTIYFDASYLDKQSLLDIEEWAHSKGLQLLIERPDFEGGEITYELIETK